MVFRTVSLASAFLLATVGIACADVSVDGGMFVTRGSTTGAAALSLGLFKTPILPISGEITGAVPFNGAGYATTFDLRFAAPDTTQIGAGIGLGNLGAPPTTRVVYDAIVAHGIVPHLSIEGRLYFGPARPSSFMAGLRLTL
jgi:hypothetical protein